MKHILNLFLLLILLGGCSTKENNERSFVKCDSVAYVSEFPDQVSLPRVKPLDLEIPGCVDVFNVDSVLICKYVDADYFWHLYSLNTLAPLGNILRKGNGRDEFLDLPGSEMDVIKNDSLFCSFDDSPKSSIYSINLSKTIETQKLSYTKKTVPLERGFMWGYQLTDSAYFLITSYKGMGRSRCVLTNGTERVVNPGNISEAVPKEELDVIAAVSAVNAEKMMVVEAYRHLPQINLYSLSSSKNLTISLKPELESYSQLDNMSKRKWYSYCGNVRSYQNYFGVLYFDMPYKDELSEVGSKSSILFFDWDGKPLLKVDVPFQATSFFIYRNMLYVYSSCDETEKLYKYVCPKKLQF